MEASKQGECLGLMERNRSRVSRLRKAQSAEGPGFARLFTHLMCPLLIAEPI
ncbi:unnamed protein product, partial [Rangifer tarandus platyrhynchus]